VIPGRIWSARAGTPAYATGIVESYFVRINHPGGHWAAWIKHTFLVQKRTRALSGACWFLLFDRTRTIVPSGVLAAREHFGEANVESAAGPGDILLGDNRLSESLCSGHIPASGISWRFSHASTGSPLVLAPATLSPLIPGTKLTTPVAEGYASGQLEFPGHILRFDNYPMSIGHNWGRRHATRYAWAQARTLSAEGRIFFEGFTLPLSGEFQDGPALTMATLVLNGRTLSFSGLVSATRNRSRAVPGRLTMDLLNDRYTLNADFCWDDTLVAALRYPQPDRALSTCLCSMLASAVLVLTPTVSDAADARMRFEVPGTAALEFLSPGPVPGRTVLA